MIQSYQGAFIHLEPVPRITAIASGDIVVSSLGPILNNLWLATAMKDNGKESKSVWILLELLTA